MDHFSLLLTARTEVFFRGSYLDSRKGSLTQELMLYEFTMYAIPEKAGSWKREDQDQGRKRGRIKIMCITVL